MKKKLFSLLLAVMMLLSMTTAVWADSLTGGSGWYVSFTGVNPLDTNFSGSEMSEKASNIQPGDDITFTIDVKNEKSGSTVNYYLKNDIIKSFETSAANGGLYTYELSYVTSTGESKVFYSNAAVGGTGSEGLMVADASLDEYFLIDTIAAGKGGKLTLKVALDGETQGNAYQDTMAQLQLNFQVEEVTQNSTTTVVTTTTPKRQTIYTTTPVKTGDLTTTLPFIITFAAAGIVVLILAIVLVKRRRSEKS